MDVKKLNDLEEKKSYAKMHKKDKTLSPKEEVTQF